MTMPRIFFWAIAALFYTAYAQDGDEATAVAASVTSTHAIDLPTARPASAFEVPPDFVSVGFETGFLPSYDNEFSANLVNSIQERMGSPIIIRIGGTSGDRISINPNQDQDVVCVKGQCPDGSSSWFRLGGGYFDKFKRFPNARWSIQAPIDEETKEVNHTNVRMYVNRIKDVVGLERIAAISAGNEVQFYEPDAKAYVADAKEAMNVAAEVLGLGDTDRRFQVLDSASGIIAGDKFGVEETWNQGFNDDKRIKHVAEHYYQVTGADPSNENIQAELMNHTAITSKFTNYIPSINFLRNNAPAVTYVLSETGSALKGSQKFQAFFGAALWSVDFQLYAMSKGVSRVSGTQRPVARHALWVPQGEPKVQGPFYAQPFIADFIGKTSSGNRGIANIDLNNPFLSAYAMYEGQNIKRIAVVNLREYTGSGQRNAVRVDLGRLGTGITSAEVGRLHANGGTDAGGFDINGKNITWQGEQWSFKQDQGKGHGEMKRNSIDVSEGKAQVTVPDSEAVIIYFGD